LKTNETPRMNREYFALGMHDALITTER